MVQKKKVINVIRKIYTYNVVDVFPVVQRNKLERSQHRPQEIVEIRVPMIGVRANTKAHVTNWAMSANNGKGTANKLYYKQTL